MRSLLLVTLAMLALAPAASAQTLTLTLSDPPAAFPEMASNATASVALSFGVTLSGVVCQAATIPVTVTATAGGAPAFFTVALDPAEPVSVSVPAGAYPGMVGPAPGPVFSGTASVNLVATTTQITDNATVPVSVSATAAFPAECTPSGSAASTDTFTIVANLTAPPPPPAPEPVPEEKGFLPGPGAFMGTLAALIAVALRRGARRS